MALTLDLEVREVAKRFADFTAVDGVSFGVPAGSFFSILGPSGCGKTTLMRMIAGFARPDAGDILIKGRSMLGVPPNRLPVNMIFQHLALFPMMSVADNIAYGLRRRRVAKTDIKTRVEQILARVGLAGLGRQRVDQLSGGQKQRVAIARCLVLEPTLLLLDEPLGALDLKLREQMKVELKQLQAEFGTTFVYITHDQSEALAMSDQVAVMNKGQFEQVGTPQELYYHPATAFVAGFVGNANRWRARVDGVDDGEVRAVTEAGLDLVARATPGVGVGGQADIFVRPEAIALGRSLDDVAPSANRLHGRVDSLLFDGGNSTVLVKGITAPVDVVAALPQTGQFADLRAGEEVYLAWQADQATCFAANEAAS